MAKDIWHDGFDGCVATTVQNQLGILPQNPRGVDTQGDVLRNPSRPPFLNPELGVFF